MFSLESDFTTVKSYPMYWYTSETDLNLLDELSSEPPAHAEETIYIIGLCRQKGWRLHLFAVESAATVGAASTSLQENLINEVVIVNCNPHVMRS